jgi:hypothetical protein
MIPVRKKPYQEHTFALCIPLELDYDRLVFLKLEHLSWSWLIGEILRIACPYTTMGKTLFKHIFTYPWSQYIWKASGIWSLLDSILNLRFGLINYWITSSFSTTMMSWRFTWELTQSYSSRHIWYRLDTSQMYIYKFLCSMLVYTPFSLCFVTLHDIFMHFPELTN